MHSIFSRPWTFPYINQCSLSMTIQPKQGIKLFSAEDSTGEGALHSKTSNGTSRFWIPPVQWLNPTLHLWKPQLNKTQFSSARWLYFTSWNPSLSYRCHTVKILRWENSADSRHEGFKIKPFARNQERIRTANHTLPAHLQLLCVRDWCLIQTYTSL